MHPPNDGLGNLNDLDVTPGGGGDLDSVLQAQAQQAPANSDAGGGKFAAIVLSRSGTDDACSAPADEAVEMIGSRGSR